MIGVVEQNQQVDVGVGVQFAAAITADGHQGDIGLVAPAELFPRLLQDIVDEPGAIFDQASNITAIAKALVQDLSCLADRLFESGNGACLQCQFGLELAAVKKFGIHLRHRLAFLSLYSFYIGRIYIDVLRCQAETRGMVSSLRRVKIS